MVATSLSNSAGFTLVEMVMAMLIMTVGLLGLLQSVNVAYEHNARNRLRDEAVLLGEEQMNQWMRGYDAITTNSLATVTRSVTGVAKDFSVSRHFDAYGNSKKLTVAVGWKFQSFSTVQVIYTMVSR